MIYHPSGPTLHPLTRRDLGGTRQIPVCQDLIVPPPGAVAPGQQTVTAERVQLIAELHERESLIRHLGVPTGPDEIMDEFATSLATSTDFLYGFVNVFLAQQTFVGLHNPPPDSGHMILGRSMSLEHGWCPAVVRRRMALPLHDVYANCRFAGNYVVDAVGIRSYFGSPLIHPETGITLGTVCVIDPDVRTLADSRRLLGLVKSAGAEVLHTLIASANDR